MTKSVKSVRIILAGRPMNDHALPQLAVLRRYKTLMRFPDGGSRTCNFSGLWSEFVGLESAQKVSVVHDFGSPMIHRNSPKIHRVGTVQSSNEISFDRWS